MEVFKSNYLSKCKDIGIEPISGILETISKLKNPPEKTTPKSFTNKLDLSGQALNFKSTSALAFALSNDIIFTKLLLSDAFIGCILLANALKTNNTVIYLDLRGNSIRSDGAVALGQMLKVNSSVKKLLLEWNCIGIWENGIHAISDALALNQTLEELDLRNNKIGPNGAQTLAACLKHNTSLRKLDLRWNNSGLIGGRAFVEMLKWNTTIIDIDLTGNELPEDVAIAIGTALERNKDKFKHELYTTAHSEQLTATLQTLSTSHHEAISNLATKLNQVDSQAVSLSTKLALASNEIQESQDAFRALEVKYERALRERNEIEQVLIRERKQDGQRITDLQHDLAREKQKRMALEDDQSTAISEIKTQALQLEASLREAEMHVEVLKRDKAMLLEELEGHKAKERTINQLWEEKIMHIDKQNHKKIMALQEFKDKEADEKIKQITERLKHVEQAKSQLEEEFDAYKTRSASEKRRMGELMGESEDRVRKEEELRRRDLDNQVTQLSKHRDKLANDYTIQGHAHTQSLRDHEAQMQRIMDQKNNMIEQIAEFKSKEMHYSSNLSDLSNKLNEARKEIQKINVEIPAMQSELARQKDIIERERKEKNELELKFQNNIISKDKLINRLRNDIKIKDDALEERDEEYYLKMKDLQLSINTLLSQRSRTKHVRTKSGETEII